MQIELAFLERVVRELENAHIPYMLVGGMVLNVYAIPRMTRDFDLVIQLKKEDIKKFVAIFEGTAYIYEPSVVEEVERKGMFNVIDWQTAFRIDFMLLKESEYYQLAFERKIRDNSLGFDIWACRAEDLILAKLDWIQVLESEKQKEDISLLLKLPDLEVEYIHFWCKKLHLKTYSLL